MWSKTNVWEVTDVKRHGIIKPDGINIIDLVEKPEPADAPSNLGIAGVYIFKPTIFRAIHDTKSGFKKEFQLTDSIKILVDQVAKVVYKKISGIQALHLKSGRVVFR